MTKEEEVELGISPLPWSLEDSVSSYPLSTCHIKTEGGYWVARDLLYPNARMMVVAPEMYEIIKRIVYLYNQAIGTESDFGSRTKTEIEFSRAIQDAVRIVDKARGINRKYRKNTRS